ncbi:MAG: TolC family protein [Myxococcota bacterium]
MKLNELSWMIAAILACAHSALAQTPAAEAESQTNVVVIDRNDAIRRSAQQNPQVTAKSAEILIAEAQIGQVNAARFPTIDFTIGVASSIAATNADGEENGVRSEESAYDDFNFNQLRPAFIGRLTATQPIYTFGKIGLRGKAAKAGLGAAEAQKNITAADIAIEVAEIYEGHLYAKELRLFAQDIKGVAVRAIEDTKVRLEAGAFDVTEQDRLRLETGLGATELLINQTDAAISQTAEGLRAFLNYPPGTMVQTEEQYLDPVSESPSTMETLIRVAEEKRPEIVALTKGIEAFDHLARAEYAEFYPNIFALGLVSGAYTPDRDFITSRYVVDPFGHFFTGVLVGAQWKLQWDTPKHRADEVRAESFRLTNLLEWAKVGLPAEINRYFQEVRRARKDIDQLKVTLPITKEWVVRATADYGAGFGDSRGVIDAIRAFVLMKNNQLDAVFRLNTNLAQLAKATGTLTDEGPLFLYPGERE